MSNSLFTRVPIDQQETIIGGVADIIIGNINTQGNNNVIAMSNNITIINMIFNFFIYPRPRSRKRGHCKF